MPLRLYHNSTFTCAIACVVHQQQMHCAWHRWLGSVRHVRYTRPSIPSLCFSFLGTNKHRTSLFVAKSQRNTMEKVVLKNTQGYTAEVYLHGAHATSWKTPEGKELLFVSKKAIFAPPKAIRGGVPVCFPQFGMMGPMAIQHGFARNVAFQVESKEDWSVTMVLKYDGSTQSGFQHPFELRITTALCDNLLTQGLNVKNTGTDELSFTTALHTYYRVSDISKVRVTGLSGTTYKDSLQKGIECEASKEAVTFSQEVDRVYVNVPGTIQVHDDATGSVVELERTHLPDAVVWNPWVDKAASMSDFGDEEYKEMVCIEPAVAASGPVKLAAGQSWQGKQLLRYLAKL